MTETLTDQARAEYVKSGGAYCPFCQALTLLSGPLEYDSCDVGLVWRGVTCLACKRKWVDQYKLADILIDEEA